MLESLALYPGSSPVKKMGEEPGYEAKKLYQQPELTGP